MKDGNYYMNVLRKTKGLNSFNKVGEFLGMSGTAVSLIRKGGGISEETANKIGKVIGIDPGIIYADINAARAKDNITKKFWNDVSKHLGTAASFILLTSALLSPTPSFASENIKPYNNSAISIYIMLKEWCRD